MDLAIDHLSQARNPRSPDVLESITLGRLYLSTGQPAEAVEVLTEMLDLEPQFTDAQVLLGRAHEALEQWEDAAAAYERAVQFSPRRARYRRRLADALANAGQTGRAIEVLQDLVRLRPEDADGWYRLADLELDGGDYDAAETSARRVVDLEPSGLRGAYALSGPLAPSASTGRWRRFSRRWSSGRRRAASTPARWPASCSSWGPHDRAWANSMPPPKR